MGDRSPSDDVPASTPYRWVAGMTPLASWALFLVCIVVGVVVYVVVVGGRRYRRMERDARIFSIRKAAWAESLPLVRILPSVYDHEARGDFDHDPIRDHEWCDGCAALLRRALNRISDRHMGPRTADDLVAAIREELEP
jgi:hypothetical protein